MEKLYKYPRTQHIAGSKFQKGDEDLSAVPFSNIADNFIVVEEKIDGANSGISFSNGELRLQSRGHFLTGGHRERHFNLLKRWANAFIVELYAILEERYVMYGEWLYAKHTVFYDKLPHYFFEFDIFDKEGEIFLSTDRRKELLSRHSFIQSVPILKEGHIESLEELKTYLGRSLYKSENWRKSLQDFCEKEKFDFETVMRQSDSSDLAEGLYLKIEKDGKVTGRCKFVREEFASQILSNDSHWLDRPIIPNMLEKGSLNWTF